MNKETDSIEINVHIPKSGIFFLGNCIRYAWNMYHRTDELLPVEIKILSGSIDIENIIQSFISIQDFNKDLQEDIEELEAQVEELDAQVDAVTVGELEAKIEELETKIDALEAQNDRLKLMTLARRDEIDM